MEKEQITLLISIVGGLAGVIIGFFLNFWNSNRIENKLEQKKYLTEHFDDFLKGAVTPILKILPTIGTRDGDISSGCWGEMEQIKDEEFQCFKVHYPVLADKWIQLVGEQQVYNSSIEGRIKKQNDKAEIFEKKVFDFLKERITEANINLPIKTYTGQEEINDDIVVQIVRNIYSHINDTYIERDINNAEISDDDFGFFVIKIGGEFLARAKNRDTLEICKNIFVDVTNAQVLKEEALLISKSAKQIINDFEFLKIELEKIQSRGLNSGNKRYRFEPNKQCEVCKELFFTK